MPANSLLPIYKIKNHQVLPTTCTDFTYHKRDTNGERMYIGTTHFATELEAYKYLVKTLTTLRPEAEYGEDYGDVLWWTLPITEPPHCGSPLDSNWQEGIYTHWTPLPIPNEEKFQPKCNKGVKK